jgi:hypothetical protein
MSELNALDSTAAFTLAHGSVPRHSDVPSVSNVWITWSLVFSQFCVTMGGLKKPSLRRLYLPFRRFLQPGFHSVLFQM